MAGLFGIKQPSLPAPVPVVNEADTQNRINNALEARLQTGGSTADQVSASGGLMAPQAAPRQPTLTGLN